MRRAAETPAAAGALLFSAEIDRGWFGDRLLVLDRELRLRLEAEEHRGEVVREGAHQRVELLHRLDVALTRDGDAILGALELRLQVAEVLVGLELRVILGHRQQAGEGAGHLALRGDEALEG